MTVGGGFLFLSDLPIGRMIHAPSRSTSSVAFLHTLPSRTRILTLVLSLSRFSFRFLRVLHVASAPSLFAGRIQFLLSSERTFNLPRFCRRRGGGGSGDGSWGRMGVEGWLVIEVEVCAATVRIRISIPMRARTKAFRSSPFNIARPFRAVFVRRRADREKRRRINLTHPDLYTCCGRKSRII